MKKRSLTKKEHIAVMQALRQSSTPVITATIRVPHGYASAKEFADDCGFELLGRNAIIEECVTEIEKFDKRAFEKQVAAIRALKDKP